ncbi:diacylglycerol acyltransferase, partial [Kipferlia bialata]
GIPELYDSCPGADMTLHLRRRRNFIRYAYRYGLPIVPTLCFGEYELFSQLQRWKKLRKKLGKAVGILITYAC